MGKPGQTGWKSHLPWLITGVSVATSTGFATVLAVGTPDGVRLTLDFLGKLLGPIGAALIAWAGVDHTIRNTKRLDQSKEWYATLRWAAELCSSSEERSVEIGVAALDALDDLPFLSEEQNVLIDKLLHQATLDHDDINDVN